MGSWDGTPPLLIVDGGQAKEDDMEAGILPAPDPPVCHADKGLFHGFALLQAPTALRGSVGIHPFSRPS